MRTNIDKQSTVPSIEGLCYIYFYYYFAEPTKRHSNSLESVKETEKQSKKAANLSDFQSSYKSDNSPPIQKEPITDSF